MVYREITFKTCPDKSLLLLLQQVLVDIHGAQGKNHPERGTDTVLFQKVFNTEIGHGPTGCLYAVSVVTHRIPNGYKLISAFPVNKFRPGDYAYR